MRQDVYKRQDYCYPPRRYPLNDGILKHGRNVLTIRLIINRGTGGFICGKKYCLQGNAYIFEGSYKGNAGNPQDAEPECGRWEFDVSGEWKYITGACMRAVSYTHLGKIDIQKNHIKPDSVCHIVQKIFTCIIYRYVYINHIFVPKGI